MFHFSHVFFSAIHQSSHQCPLPRLHSCTSNVQRPVMLMYAYFSSYSLPVDLELSFCTTPPLPLVRCSPLPVLGSIVRQLSHSSHKLLHAGVKAWVTSPLRQRPPSVCDPSSISIAWSSPLIASNEDPGRWSWCGAVWHAVLRLCAMAASSESYCFFLGFPP